jgi:hypothetical protein
LDESEFGRFESELGRFWQNSVMQSKKLIIFIFSMALKLFLEAFYFEKSIELLIYGHYLGRPIHSRSNDFEAELNLIVLGFRIDWLILSL